MKAPNDFDPDIATVLEIVQHAGEILTRLPLTAVRQHLAGAVEPGAWKERALKFALAAERFELAGAELAAEEARSESMADPKPAGPLDMYPDDALPSV